MTAAVPETDLAKAVGALLPVIGQRADESERLRRLPADLATDMAGAGLFRMMIPQAIGGLECDAATALGMMEQVAHADAAAGWCVMIGATSAYKSGFLDRATAQEIYGDPMGIYGGIFAPMGRATVTADGYRLSGRWSWASGSPNCTWLSGGAVILQDGKPKMLENGAPDSRMLIFPAAEAELPDTWHVAGLAGTGSGDMAVRDIFVPAQRSVSLMHSAATADGPLYRLPTFGLLAMGIGAVALGNAAAAIDDLVDLAATKKSVGSKRTLAERGQAQTVLAEQTARLRAARALFADALGAAWDQAVRGDEHDVTARTGMRLAATHATRTAADVCREMYDLGGGDALFLTSPLQRRMRDALAMTQHMMTNRGTWELTGRVLFGLPTDATFL